jgi:hypothetical protein
VCVLSLLILLVTVKPAALARCAMLAGYITSQISRVEGIASLLRALNAAMNLRPSGELSYSAQCASSSDRLSYRCSGEKCLPGAN